MFGCATRPRGIEPETALSDLSAEDNIGKLVTLGTGGVDLPDGDSDIPYAVLVDGAATGLDCGVIELGNSAGEVPLRASGAISKGDLICPQAVSTAAGAVRTLPTSGGGTTNVIGRAKESAVDGQLFRASVHAPRLTTIAG